MVAVIAHVPEPAVIDTEPDEFTLQAVDDPADHVNAFAVVPPDVESDTVEPNDALEEPEIVKAA